MLSRLPGGVFSAFGGEGGGECEDLPVVVAELEYPTIRVIKTIDCKINFLACVRCGYILIYFT